MATFRHLANSCTKNLFLQSPIGLQSVVRRVSTRRLESTMIAETFLQRCLAKDRCSTPEQRPWRGGTYDQIREVMPLQAS